MMLLLLFTFLLMSQEGSHPAVRHALEVSSALLLVLAIHVCHLIVVS
jgi:hypothetical protein